MFMKLTEYENFLIPNAGATDAVQAQTYLCTSIQHTCADVLHACSASEYSSAEAPFSSLIPVNVS